MPDKSVRQHVIARARKVVVKVGSSALTGADGRPDRAVMNSLASQISAVLDRGISVVLVASGAIGAGLAELDIPQRPDGLALLQATAAVGQGQLMRFFHDAFAKQNVKVAQVLLTRDDFENRARYLNIRNTLLALEQYHAIAIVNENDAVAVDEISYGDNDIIAAHLAAMIGADVLILLTVVDGVLKDGGVLDVIERVDFETLSLASDETSSLGSGGMKTKIIAAGMVTDAGEAAIIANAATPNILQKILDGERIGTCFIPSAKKMSSRDRWISQVSGIMGKITIDSGAARAIANDGKSLLPSGITKISGDFEKGAAVSVTNATGTEIARGLVNYSSSQIERIKGLKTSQIQNALDENGGIDGIGENLYDEIIHRDNMTLTLPTGEKNEDNAWQE